MGKSKMGLLRRAKGKLASALDKIVARVRRRDNPQPEDPQWEGFSDVFDAGSPHFSFVPTPESAYRRHGPLVRSSTGLFIPHSDPTQGLFWAEPVDPPSATSFPCADLRYLGANYEDGSSCAALDSSSSSSSRFETSSDALMSSLLGGLPDIPRLRRRSGRRNLLSSRSSSAHDAISNSDISSVGQGQTTQTENSQGQRQYPLDNELRPQSIVSESVQGDVLTSPAAGPVDGSPGPTIREDSAPLPSLPSLRANDSQASHISVPQRPQNPLVQTFALGSDTLPDPFVAGPAPTQAITNGNNGGHQLWSEFSSSSDSRPSPVYLGSGRYLLHDGTVHDIQPGRPRLRETSNTGVRPVRREIRNASSDEANDADRSDSIGLGSESSPSNPPRAAIRRLQTAVSNLEGFAGPTSREAVQGLEQAVDGIVDVVNTLLDDIEIHAYNAEERRRRLDERTRELAEAEQMIQERDAEINRLSHPEVYGEHTTPPRYASDVQEGHLSVTRTPGGVRDNNNASPTPATVVRHPEPETDRASDREVSVTGRYGSAAPSYRTSPDTESVAAPSYRTSPDTESAVQPLTPQVVADGSPPSSPSGESDNIMLRRTPLFRRPTI